VKAFFSTGRDPERVLELEDGSVQRDEKKSDDPVTVTERNAHQSHWLIVPSGTIVSEVGAAGDEKSYTRECTHACPGTLSLIVNTRLVVS
jgi:hypothetical protein